MNFFSNILLNHCHGQFSAAVRFLFETVVPTVNGTTASGNGAAETTTISTTASVASTASAASTASTVAETAATTAKAASSSTVSVGSVILTILVILAILFVIAAVFLAYIRITNNLFYKVFKRPHEMPAVDRSPLEIDQSTVFGKGKNWFYTNRLEFFNVRVNAYDGTKLAGYYRPSFDRDCRNVLILLHGYNEHPSEMSAYARLFMSKIQCNVLMVHERAHCMSGGKFVTYGLRESVDLSTWIEFAKKQAGDDARIFIMGRSMGGFTALLAAEQSDFSENVAGIIADSPYDTLENTLVRSGRRRFKIDTSFFLRRIKRIALARLKLDISLCDCVTHADRIRVPVLLFHGESDVVAPPDCSRKIYERLRSPKRMVIVENTPHIMSYNNAPVLYEKEVAQFIENCVIRLVKNGRM